MVQIHSNFSKKEMNYVMNFVSIHNLLEQSLLNACATCVPFDDSWNNPFICLGLGEKKAHRQIHESQENQSWNQKFLNLDR